MANRPLALIALERLLRRIPGPAQHSAHSWHPAIGEWNSLSRGNLLSLNSYHGLENNFGRLCVLAPHSHPQAALRNPTLAHLGFNLKTHQHTDIYRSSQHRRAARERALREAHVVQHCSHGAAAQRPGKSSTTRFRATTLVFLPVATKYLLDNLLFTLRINQVTRLRNGELFVVPVRDVTAATWTTQVTMSPLTNATKAENMTTITGQANGHDQRLKTDTALEARIQDRSQT
mmetsp:Transcript_43812/g.115818  ORF Transcript_43812/g.115818 Transcript_43812/m.115818 type:complete len:232 (+) Transcript_43812:632-1327(+)